MSTRGLPISRTRVVFLSSPTWAFRASAVLSAAIVLISGFVFVPVASASDLSVPPSLVSFSRTSADVVNDGDKISVDWVVQDAPVTFMGFYFRDSLGHSEIVRWDGAPAYSGTSTLIVDTAVWSAGPLELWSVNYQNDSASIDLREGGLFYKNPSGLKDPVFTQFDFTSATMNLGTLSNLISTPVPTVSGSAVVGETVTAAVGVWAPAPVELAYQWQRDRVGIAGATAAAYGLVAADEGHAITVVVTGSKAGYVTESKTSAATATVTTAPPIETKYYVTAYDRTVWAVTPTSITALTYEQWVGLGMPIPLAAPTDYVKYPWSPSISAVTFFGQEQSRWVWKHVSFDEWNRAGQPAPRTAGWIADSSYYQWEGSNQIFVQDSGAVKHALSYGEWQASGFQPFTKKTNQGFVKLSWDSSIAFLTDYAAGQGAPIGYSTWQGEGFPAPSVRVRFPGDQLYKDYGSSAIWYVGPTVNRQITYDAWAAMGFASFTVRGLPAYPADKDCRDYNSQGEAQQQFNYYYEAYGDVFRLDGDNDGVACESYFG